VGCHHAESMAKALVGLYALVGPRRAADLLAPQRESKLAKPRATSMDQGERVDAWKHTRTATGQGKAIRPGNADSMREVREDLNGVRERRSGGRDWKTFGRGCPRFSASCNSCCCQDVWGDSPCWKRAPSFSSD
jgi:hypothetical protein